ncbi:hypothetical protein PHLCEN_2v18 [Hermanssonia centrifuga]|uniref:EB1 C-terminal domain-containing protein n=1 Tax=Hermanssonia centrifuga TaxID=98765 RepID=A0A2R6S734_9APHY|nr:hypothetical protein PHLCEN_2v18 [Hermanssonia centrifuga]
MNAKHEYEFIANFKILQGIFRAKKIDKARYILYLVKDNLEFLQWVKRFWDSNFGGQGYDPVGRRRGVPTDTPATIAPLGAPARSVGLGVSGVRSGGKTPVTGHRSGSTQPNEALQAARAQMQAMQGQLEDMQVQMQGLEKERDFYFAKLRDIEILVQQRLEGGDQANLNEAGEDATLSEIQRILYSTEEGFEVPAEQAVDEEETF